MEKKENLYEPVINFRENRSQIQIKREESTELYEKAFFTEEPHTSSEYALNTTTWD